MEQSNQTDFLDVPTLLQASMPVPGIPWVWLAMGTVIGLLVAAVAWEKNPAVEIVASLGVGGIFLTLPVLVYFAAKPLRVQQEAVTGVGEMLQLRRWPEAAVVLQQLLSNPVRSMQVRSEALVYLAGLLARYQRCDDAIAVQNHLLEHELTSPATAYGLKLGRAMAMLREDHLFDADQAISRLRREGPSDSAAFALLDMYRDVKTGHPDEALKIFRDRLGIMRDQLGHRLADVYALAARAHDLLDQTPEAADAFYRATLLAPVIELTRRYPEVQKLIGRYPAATAPEEMA